MKITKIAKLLYYRFFVEPLDDVKFLQAKTLIEHILCKGRLKNIQEAEFKVFSQFGDDGIIQYILGRINLPKEMQKFVEFGVGDYTEANTRFLLINNNWSGLIIDASEDNANYIKADHIYWKHQIKVLNEFITVANINSIITKEGFAENLGLLHIDIDGNDYWVWKAINVSKPVVVVIEYNSVFGFKKPVSVSYKRNFDRTKAHYSNLYWGASLKAYCVLAKTKGYVFIGTNSAGNNAYFVRKDYSRGFNLFTCENGYTKSKLRDSRGKNGKLTYLGGDDRLKEMKNMFVEDVENGKVIKLSELMK